MFTLPWDNAVMGFNSTGSNPQQQAFGAGLWIGKNQLLANATDNLPESLAPADNQPWQNSQWADFYQLGRWMFLLWVETQTEVGQANWTQHAEILHQLMDQSEEPKTKVNGSIRAIDAQLQRLIVSPNSAREQNQLRRMLEMSMQEYAPD